MNRIISLLVFYKSYQKALGTSYINIYISKIISEFFKNIFSKYQTGFRKCFNAQNCLVVMIKRIENVSITESNTKFYSPIY